ncbi:hypothetical protein C5S32_07740 [ANME-1 cluster archaeon GoMg1]|nr:hypothetical protein [ANME-1 cluster archaeon GoMg1]
MEAEIAKVETEIIENNAVSYQQLEFLKQQKKGSLIKQYFRIYNQFETDKELEEAEIETLKKIQEAFNLTMKQLKTKLAILGLIMVFSVPVLWNIGLRLITLRAESSAKNRISSRYPEQEF